jgi:hypothetical protein
LPGILGFHDDEHVARPHLFLHAGTAPFYCFQVISTLLVDGVEKQSLVIQRLWQGWYIPARYVQANKKQLESKMVNHFRRAHEAGRCV